MKKKYWIIFLIVLLVVVNISTYCGYGRMNRARDNKEFIELDQVDSIKMWKATVNGDTVEHPWKNLSSDKVADFVKHWNWADGSFAKKFIPVYYIEVYLKKNSIREFKAAGGRLREGRYYYSSYTISGNYFEGLYGE
jgi:hypothetical protein